jgi:hypothetical protein
LSVIEANESQLAKPEGSAEFYFYSANWNPRILGLIPPSQIRKFLGSFRHRKSVNFFSVQFCKSQIRNFLWLFHNSQMGSFLGVPICLSQIRKLFILHTKQISSWDSFKKICCTIFNCIYLSGYAYIGNVCLV